MTCAIVPRGPSSPLQRSAKISAPLFSGSPQQDIARSRPSLRDTIKQSPLQAPSGQTVEEGLVDAFPDYHTSWTDKGSNIQRQSEPHVEVKPDSYVTYKGVDGTVVIDLDEEDETEIPSMDVDVAQVEDYQFWNPSPATITSDRSPMGLFENVGWISSDHRTYKPGKTVELFDGDFLRLKSVIRNTRTTEVFLLGHRLRRAKKLNGLLELKLNEVVMVLVVEENDPRPIMVQGIEQVPLGKVGRIRELVITNKPFPELSFRELDYGSNDDCVSRNGRLVCRWKYILSFPGPRDRNLNRNCEKSLTRVNESEVEQRFATSDDLLRQDWRGNTVKGGACLRVSAEEEEFDRREKDQVKTTTKRSIDQSRHSHESSANYRVDSKIRRTGNGSISSSSVVEVSSSPHGSLSNPFIVDEETHDQSRAVKLQTHIDLTRDADPVLSLSTLSLQSLSQDATEPFERSTSRDLAEMSTEVTTIANGAVVRFKYNGALSSTDSTTPPAKRLKMLHRNGAISPLTDSTIFPPQPRTARLGMLRSADDLPCLSLCHQAPSSASASKRTLSHDSHCEVRDQPYSASGTAPPNSTFEGGQKHTFREDPMTQSRQRQKYTFGDAFCGAGGTSRGAKMAGFRVNWGFDFDPAAINSYRLNFYNTDCIAAWAHNFVESSIGDESKVDVLHLSPPCQVFSFAHTVDGKDDEMNSATFFAVVELLKRTKPRVVTLENTSGLAVLHPIWLNSAIHFFTSLGFSVRWKVLNLAEYGLPQARKRLIIFASW